ncbi:MAG: Cu(I)-responsive transcriptional regulator [Pseudomonadota bacterium]
MDALVSPLDIGPLDISRCARATGVPAKTIRYYESIGLLPPPKRALNGYRRYGGNEIETLRFVRRARDLGFSLDEIAKLLALWRDKNRASADVKALALEHARVLDDRIEQLKAVRGTILALAERCHGDRRPDCPILADIATGTDHHIMRAARKSPRPDRGASLNNARGDSPARPKKRK